MIADKLEVAGSRIMMFLVTVWQLVTTLTRQFQSTGDNDRKNQYVIDSRKECRGRHETICKMLSALPYQTTTESAFN